MFSLEALIIIILINNICLSSTELAQIKGNQNSIGLKRFFSDVIDKNDVNLFITDDQNDLITSLNNFPLYKINSTHLREFFGTIQNKPRTCIIFVNSNETLNKIVTSHSDVFIGTSEYLVITMEDALVQSIAEALWTAKLFYSYIISAKKDIDDTYLYMLDIRDCGAKAFAKHLTILNEDTRIEDIPKWNLKSNFLRCPLYAAWALMPPFINSINTSWAGIYIDVMKVFDLYSGRKIVYRPYNPVYLEEISLAYNYDTLLEDFNSEYVQIFIGPSDIQISTILDTSPILSENNLVFLIPKPIITYWERLYSLNLFDKLAINAVLQIMFIGTFYRVAKNTQDKMISKANTYFLLLGLLINSNPLHKLPKNGFLGIFLGLYIIHSMVFSIYIQGILVSSLSGSLYGKPIGNVVELLDSNLPIKIVNGMAFIFQISRDSKDTEIYGRLETLQDAVFPFDAGNIAVCSRDFATIVDTGYLIQRPNILKSFSIFETFIYRQVLPMPKNAYFVNEYNKWFTRIIEIGIISKYKDLYKNFYALTYFVEEDKRHFVMTFKQIQNVLLMAAAGYFISFVVFLAELLIDLWKCYLK